MARSTLEQWRMFKAVAEHGGFQQAADVIFKSQSSSKASQPSLKSGLPLTAAKLL